VWPRARDRQRAADGEGDYSRLDQTLMLGRKQSLLRKSSIAVQVEIVFSITALAPMEENQSTHAILQRVRRLVRCVGAAGQLRA
jgi:hypothetical protein